MVGCLTLGNTQRTVDGTTRTLLLHPAWPRTPHREAPDPVATVAEQSGLSGDLSEMEVAFPQKAVNYTAPSQVKRRSADTGGGGDAVGKFGPLLVHSLLAHGLLPPGCCCWCPW